MTIARSEVKITGNLNPNTIPVGEDGIINENVSFETEKTRNPNVLGVVDRMMRPDHFLNLLAEEADSREDILVSDVSLLDIKYKESESNKFSHFYISPKPEQLPKGSKIREWFEEYKEMRLDYTGFRSACHQIERTPGIMNNFANPQARFLSELSDYFRRSSGKGLLIRTTNHGKDEKHRTVDAFAPSKMNTISNFQLMSAIMHRIKHVYGDVIRGVQMMNGSNPDNLSYRLLFGNPIHREANGGDHRKMSFLMFNFMGTEHGLGKTNIDLGFWRMWCSNGAMRQDLSLCHVSWRRFDSEKNFLSKVSNLVNMSGVYGDCIGRLMKSLEGMPLEREPHDLLTALSEQGFIDNRVFDTAMFGINILLPETNWDFLNLLTDASKTHADMRTRSKAESRALMLAMQPRSFNGVATEGISKTSAKGDFASDLRNFNPRNN